MQLIDISTPRAPKIQKSIRQILSVPDLTFPTDTEPDFAVNGKNLFYEEDYKLHHLNVLGTDANTNGISDAWEKFYFDSEVVNPNQDVNNDGLTNLAEYLRNTNPIKTDTDEDGTSDGDKITAKTEPTIAGILLKKVQTILSPIMDNLLLN